MEKLGIFDLWKSFQSAVNTMQGGFYRPQTDFQQKVNDISNDLWVKWTNEAEKSQEARDNLSFFLQSENVIASPAKSNFGTVPFPDDYGRFSGLRIVVSGDKTVPSEEVNNGKCDGFQSEQEKTDKYYESLEEHNVELIDNMRWGSCLSHKTKFPTLQNPKAMQIDEGFRVAPRQISVVVLDYYVRPYNAIFGYTLAAGDKQTGAGAQIIFDQSKSKDLPWPSTVKNEFLVRLGEAYGLYTRDQFVSQFSTQQKMTA